MADSDQYDSSGRGAARAGSAPFLVELEHARPSNALHASWHDYAMGIGRAEALGMVRAGLTHQIRALRSMVREMVSGLDVDPGARRSLLAKLDLMMAAADRYAAALRQR